MGYAAGSLDVGVVDGNCWGFARGVCFRGLEFVCVEVRLVAFISLVTETDGDRSIARTTSFMCLLGLQGTLLEAGLYSNEQLTPAIHVIFMVIKAAPPIVSFSAMYVDSSPPAVLWTFLIKLGISGFMS